MIFVGIDIVKLPTPSTISNCNLTRLTTFLTKYSRGKYSKVKVIELLNHFYLTSYSYLSYFKSTATQINLYLR